MATSGLLLTAGEAIEHVRARRGCGNDLAEAFLQELAFGDRESIRVGEEHPYRSLTDDECAKGLTIDFSEGIICLGKEVKLDGGAYFGCISIMQPRLVMRFVSRILNVALDQIGAGEPKAKYFGGGRPRSTAWTVAVRRIGHLIWHHGIPERPERAWIDNLLAHLADEGHELPDESTVRRWLDAEFRLYRSEVGL